ncbi:hypothetical protein AMECASPLE_018111 [Ameca splendens]|uniref:Uncharacterized protein n=1 Tax=Ameca splendens TaxID=208324 RepID=A0ABV0XFP3_9TELE
MLFFHNDREADGKMDGANRALSWKKTCQWVGKSRLEWSSQCPDAKPLDTVWQDMKIALHELLPNSKQIPDCRGYKRACSISIHPFSLPAYSVPGRWGAGAHLQWSRVSVMALGRSPGHHTALQYNDMKCVKAS